MQVRVFENPIIKDKITFLKTAAETNGEYTLLEVELAHGGGNPIHFHKTYSETFRPIKGDLGVLVGTEHKMLKVGEAFTIEPPILHRFYNPGNEPIKFYTELRPASEGFENLISIIYGLAQAGLTTKGGIPKNPVYAAVITHMGDTHGPGIVGFLSPVISFIAKLARIFKIEKKLIEKYKPAKN